MLLYIARTGLITEKALLIYNYALVSDKLVQVFLTLSLTIMFYNMLFQWSSHLRHIPSLDLNDRSDIIRAVLIVMLFLFSISFIQLTNFWNDFFFLTVYLCMAVLNIAPFHHHLLKLLKYIALNKSIKVAQINCYVNRGIFRSDKQLLNQLWNSLASHAWLYYHLGKATSFSTMFSHSASLYQHLFCDMIFTN